MQMMTLLQHGQTKGCCIKSPNSCLFVVTEAMIKQQLAP